MSAVEHMIFPRDGGEGEAGFAALLKLSALGTVEFSAAPDPDCGRHVAIVEERDTQYVSGATGERIREPAVVGFRTPEGNHHIGPHQPQFCNASFSVAVRSKNKVVRSGTGTTATRALLAAAAGL